MANYKLGLGTIIKGNALTELQKLKSNSVNSIITSPPYWPARKYTEDTKIVWGGNPKCKHTWKILGILQQLGKSEKSTTIGKMPKARRYRNVSCICKKCKAVKAQLGLEPSLTLYMQHMKQIIHELVRVLRKDGVMYINWADTYRNKALTMQNYRVINYFVIEGSLILRDIIIWYKPNHMPEVVYDRMVRGYEPIFMLTKSKNYFFNKSVIKVPTKRINDKKREKNKLYKVMDNIIKFNTTQSKLNHFAAFPEDMIKLLLLSSTPKNGIVLDPFHGTGTVGVVAEKNNRNWIGIELSEEYTKMSYERITKVIKEKDAFLF